MSRVDIVTLNVSITNPPIPSALQKTGAFISMGATTLAAGTLSVLTSVSDLAAIIGTGANVAELQAMNATFFAQGRAQSVYVFETGVATAALAVPVVKNFIDTNPNVVYSWLCPRSFDGATGFAALCAEHQAPTDKVNFFVTTTSANAPALSQLNNSVIAIIEAPNKPSTEFSMAALFYITLAWTPNSGSKIPPLAFAFTYGTTIYPDFNNGTVLYNLQQNNVGFISSAAEGGLVNSMVKWGHTLGGNPFNYWYTVDWAAINIELDLANEIINGSNNSIAPLYYDQNGIDRLQNRAAKTLRNGVAYGLILGNVIMTELSPAEFINQVALGTYAGNAVINAVPFKKYTADNPSDFMVGKYGGLQAVITPARGFESIVFNLNITNFVA